MKKAGRLAAVLAAVLLALPFLALPTLQETVPVDLSPVQPAAESIAVSAQPVSLPAAPTNHIAGNEDKLDAALDEICQQYGVKACSAAAFEGEQIVYTHSYGKARGDTPADENTKYRVASISKAVTAMLAMHLVDEGKLSLDMDIADIHPDLQNPYYPDSTTTLEMLLTHTSGIVDGAGYNWAISQSVFPSLDQVLQYSNFSGSAPGEQYAYTNFGMGLVSAAIEYATGQPFRSYAQQVLFEPLGLDAGFLTDDIDDPQTIAVLGSVDPLDWGKMEKAYARIPVGQMYLLGQGELYISAKDLARIAMILAGDGSFLPAGSDTRQTFLSAETLEEMHTPKVYDEATNTTRGLALQMSDEIVDGVTLWGHQGNAYGVISCLFYDRESHKGLAFLTSSASQMRAENKIYAVNDAAVRAVWEYLQ